MPGGSHWGGAERIPVGWCQHRAAPQGDPGERPPASDPAAEPAGECGHPMPWPSSTLLSLPPPSSAFLPPPDPGAGGIWLRPLRLPGRQLGAEGHEGRWQPQIGSAEEVQTLPCAGGPAGMGRDWGWGLAAAALWVMGTEQDGCRGGGPHIRAPSGSPSLPQVDDNPLSEQEYVSGKRFVSLTNEGVGCPVLPIRMEMGHTWVPLPVSPQHGVPRTLCIPLLPGQGNPGLGPRRAPKSQPDPMPIPGVSHQVLHPTKEHIQPDGSRVSPWRDRLERWDPNAGGRRDTQTFPGIPLLQLQPRPRIPAWIPQTAPARLRCLQKPLSGVSYPPPALIISREKLSANEGELIHHSRTFLAGAGYK